MKYYLLNKQDCLDNIWTNPKILKTKSFAKIEKLKRLEKQIDKLKKDIYKEIKSSNSRMTPDEYIEQLLSGEVDEITGVDFNALYNLPLYDLQAQRINCYNRSETLRGKLYGDQIVLDKNTIK